MTSLKISIQGLPKDKEIHAIRGIVDKLLDEKFQSFKFVWEMGKELMD